MCSISQKKKETVYDKERDFGFLRQTAVGV